MIRRLAVLALVVTACGGATGRETTSTMPEPATTESTTTTPAPNPLTAFTTVDVEVSGSSWKVALADTPALTASDHRSRALQHLGLHKPLLQKDLGAAADRNPAQIPVI